MAYAQSSRRNIAFAKFCSRDEKAPSYGGFSYLT